jgi:hypothetical protein
MIETFNIADWQTDFSNESRQQALLSLENGKVLFLPQLRFTLSDIEAEFLSAQLVQAKTKNISFDPSSGILKGSTCPETQASPLKNMLQRYAQSTQQLLDKLLPPYCQYLKIARTSFRPVEIAGRPTSLRKDDTRLHVDAFPASPTGGQRILRVFSNVNEKDKARIWRLGAPFKEVVTHFLPRLSKPIPGSSRLMQALKITRGKRSLYDHYMLQLHNAMKLDPDYQKNVSQLEYHFPAGSTWIVYTDQVSHAAMKGQHAFEQTFYLPRQAMVNRLTAPQSVLEEYLGNSLTEDDT